MATQNHEFKLMLVGDGGVGKTTFLTRHRTGNFTRVYLATMGVEVSKLTFNTESHGSVTFSCWDTAGQEKFAGLRDVYYTGADATLMMFDVTSRTTYNSIPTWYSDIPEELRTKPMVLCGNKVDCRVRRVKPKTIRFHKGKNIQYYDISSKSNYNFEKPFLYLARALLNAPDLRFTWSLGLRPPEAEIEPDTVREWQEKLNMLLSEE